MIFLAKNEGHKHRPVWLSDYQGVFFQTWQSKLCFSIAQRLVDWCERFLCWGNQWNEPLYKENQHKVVYCPIYIYIYMNTCWHSIFESRQSEIGLSQQHLGSQSDPWFSALGWPCATSVPQRHDHHMAAVLATGGRRASDLLAGCHSRRTTKEPPEPSDRWILSTGIVD